ncbi:aminotransferase class I/II-fold pyridoxal phosphate-dependent enzyme [Pseudomonas sp. NPDC088444]|uniref:aminotransferase class I/II-fold pyridoxal phosphate-dependent enzyme n=1 Tax=Pseudomonas sp. NPDC088444 TaxID=3364456 RepID=UPI00384FA8AA
MKLYRSAIEAEGAEVIGYENIKYNLAESSVRDRSMADLGVELKGLGLPYAQDHFGMTKLRELIAKQSGAHVETDHIMVTAGASAALFIVALTLLEKGDHIVITRPNYCTNIETPEAIGCDITFVELNYDNAFRVDIDYLESVVTPKTKYVSLTCPNNPDGSMLTLEELNRIIQIVERNRTYLLVDETYREMAHENLLPVAATLSDRVISVSSVSKSYGVPGIRIGWIHCQDAGLMESFLCAKEQMSIHGSILDETVAYETLLQRDAWMAEAMQEILEGKRIVSEWVASDPHIDWVEPQGGTTCFARIDGSLNIDYDEFYKRLLEVYGAYVGPGHWFGFSKNYMRIGFAWNDMDSLKRGLDGISKNIRDFI